MRNCTFSICDDSIMILEWVLWGGIHHIFHKAVIWRVGVVGELSPKTYLHFCQVFLPPSSWPPTRRLAGLVITLNTTYHHGISIELNYMDFH